MTKYLLKAEFILLAILAVAAALELMGTKLDVLYPISLAGLGLVFFLFAQFPDESNKSKQEEKTDEENISSFLLLLAYVIVPKVLWIGTAVTTIGIMFSFQNFKGAENLLIVGGITIAVCTAILLILRIMNIRNLQTVIPVLYRSYPALLAAAYLLFA